jgi:AraC-like DNA-binding protein
MLAPPDHYGQRLFRTGGIPDGQRFAAWNGVVNGWLLGAEMRQSGAGPFQGSACLRVLPELRFGWGALGGTSSRRTRAIVSRDNDDLFLFVNAGGAFSASQCGRETDIAAGGAYLMSCAERGEYRWPDGMKLMVVRTRLDAVSALVRNVYDSLGRVIASDNQGLHLLIRYLRLLDDSEPLATPQSRALVTRHVQDLLALALGAVGDARRIADARSVHAVRLKAIEAYVERHLGRPELSLDAVARHFRISPRTVQRLFETEGTSFTGFVLGGRLARAYATLGDLRGDDRSIGDIALSCGFGNISYFNRQFRSRYLITPSDARHRDLERRG